LRSRKRLAMGDEVGIPKLLGFNGAVTLRSRKPETTSARLTPTC
jgi:hypothetical protein